MTTRLTNTTHNRHRTITTIVARTITVITDTLMRAGFSFVALLMTLSACSGLKRTLHVKKIFTKTEIRWDVMTDRSNGKVTDSTFNVLVSLHFATAGRNYGTESLKTALDSFITEFIRCIVNRKKSTIRSRLAMRNKARGT